MAVVSDQIPLILQQELLRGMQIDLPYPAGRSAQNYMPGAAQLHAPGTARHLIESAETFLLRYGVQGINLQYFSDVPLPPGTRCDLKPRLQQANHAMAVPEGEIISSFRATLLAIAPVTAVVTPYKAGDYTGLNPLPPTSVGRLIDTDGRSGRDFGVDPALLAVIAGVAHKDTFDPYAAPTTQGLMAATVGAASAAVQARSRIAPVQEVRDLSQYDAGRIRAEISELADRHRDHGYNTEAPKPESNLPMQEIKDSMGNILMRGRAESVEHLIAIKMREAETTNDPSKKVLNLAGAQLDEHTLGRKLNLTGFDMQNVNLRGANLAGAEIKECGFKNCDMEGVNLKKATVSLCSFENVNMNSFVGDNKTKFENCAMTNVHMQEAEAPGVRFENIRAEKLNIKDANFKGSSWTHVHVNDLHGPNARMDGAKIGDLRVIGRESNLDGWKLNGASIHNASFGTSQYGLRMGGIEAQNSTWSDVQFNRSDLSSSDFTKASFTRVDMRQVITPRGPMEMKEANLTGLTAGTEARFTAFKATHSGITMYPSENFAFHGTAPIERAAHAAISVRSNIANITSASGSTTQEQEAKQAMEQSAKMAEEDEEELRKKRMLQQQQMLQKRRQAEMAPSPYNRSKKKDTPW